MKNQIIKIVLVSFITLCFFNTASAALKIEADVNVPASCIVTDDKGIIHTYPQTNSYLAICALEKALEQNAISNIDFADFGFGLFINSVNNISQNNTYWQLRLNDISSSVGVSDLTLQASDTISLILTAFDPVTFAETSLDDQVVIHINSLDTLPPVDPEPAPEPEPAPVPEPIVSRSSGGGSRIILTPIAIAPEPKPTFDLKKASDFLISQQKENGSFGEDLYTDWATLALTTEDFQDQKTKLVKYFQKSKITVMSLTDYERHAMALMALGLNPYNVNGENYIEKITTSFDGKQFGDVNEDNDDIFALIVLQNAGYGMNDKIINDDISFILNRQRENGSWDESVDMTGAGIEALAVFSPIPGMGGSLAKAREFLKQNQKEDGGWGNASSTAWAIEGILALDEKIENWIKNGNTPLDYLATMQGEDGGIKDENLQNKIWETAYVVSALSGKTWNQIMQKFEKQTIVKIENLQKETIIETIIKSPKKITKNKKVVTTATAINAIDPLPIAPQTEQKEVPQKNWFVKLLDSIFSIF